MGPAGFDIDFIFANLHAALSDVMPEDVPVIAGTAYVRHRSALTDPKVTALPLSVQQQNLMWAGPFATIHTTGKQTMVYMDRSDQLLGLFTIHSGSPTFGPACDAVAKKMRWIGQSEYSVWELIDATRVAIEHAPIGTGLVGTRVGSATRAWFTAVLSTLESDPSAASSYAHAIVPDDTIVVAPVVLPELDLVNPDFPSHPWRTPEH